MAVARPRENEETKQSAYLISVLYEPAESITLISYFAFEIIMAWPADRVQYVTEFG